MKKFIEKWQSDSKFQVKVKFGLSLLFVILVAMFAGNTNKRINSNNSSSLEENNNTKNELITKINIPKAYKYQVKIKVNDKNYMYDCVKELSKEIIIKHVDDTIVNYIYQDNNYYKEENGVYILTTKDEVYDLINQSHINLETINQYLDKSTSNNKNTHKVLLKDIILGYEDDKYITITINDNYINIDYTSLMQLFDKSIESHLVEIEIEEINGEVKRSEEE